VLSRRLPLLSDQSLDPGSSIPSAEVPLDEASTRVQAIHPSGLPLARHRPDGTSSGFGFPPSFEPRRPGAGRRTSRWGQAIEHGPGTTLYVIDLASNPACSLVACDLASHRSNHHSEELALALVLAGPVGPCHSWDLFERFTEAARQVVVCAQQEARDLKHGHIGTEHELLGLLWVNDGPTADVLGSLGITLEHARDQAVRIVGPGERVAPDQIPFTPRAKKVLELSLREALALGHNHIGPEHLLLGLLTDNGGTANRILDEAGADPESIRSQ